MHSELELPIPIGVPARIDPAADISIPDPLPMVRLGAVAVHAITEAQCIAHVMRELDAGRGGFMATPNLDHLRRLQKSAAFLEIYQHADVVVADGMPLIWAAKLQGTPLPGRVAGSNLISTLSAAAALRGRSIYLLGGVPGSAQLASQRLQLRYPALRVAGIHCPQNGFENDPEAMAAIAGKLDQARPDIVYVGLGSPKQEHLIIKLRPLLPRAWWLGVGVSFSFVSGHIRRAPPWMQRSGLEWLHRLAREPRRLARRYLVEDLPFGVQLLGSAIGTRIRNGRPSA